MHPRMHLRFEGALVDRAPAVVIRQAGPAGNGPGLLRRDDVDHITPDGLADLRVDGHLDGVHRLEAAALRTLHPLDHAGVARRPALLEQRLLGELVLGIEDQQLRFRLVLFQVVGNHAGTLIGAGRAAERVVRRRDHHDAAVSHGLELASQQQRLLARLPGVRHHLAGRLVVALDRTPAQIDAG